MQVNENENKGVILYDRVIYRIGIGRELASGASAAHKFIQISTNK